MSVIPERRLKAAIGFIFVTAVLVVAAGVGWITARGAERAESSAV